MPLGVQILLTIMGCIVVLLGVWLIYDGYKLSRDILREKKEAKKMPFHSSEFEYTPGQDDLTPQQRITLLEEHNTALRRRLDRLETELSRQVTALHAYLNVEYQYTPAERKLVKIKKAPK